MSKLPFMKFYTTDFMMDVQTLNLEKRGAWITIICHIWHKSKNGTIELSDAELASLLHIDEARAKAIILDLASANIFDFSLKNSEKGDGFVVNVITSRRITKDKKSLSMNALYQSNARVRVESGKSKVKVRDKKSEVRSQKSEVRYKEEPLTPYGETDGNNKDLSEKANKLVSLWNKRADANLPRVSYVTQKRLSHARNRIKEYPNGDFWIKMIDKVNDSPFLRGDVIGRNEKPFKCTFDWFINPNNLAKIMEGNYDDRHRNNGPSKELDSILGSGSGEEDNMGSGLPKL